MMAIHYSLEMTSLTTAPSNTEEKTPKMIPSCPKQDFWTVMDELDTQSL